jgi:hypothetical protein
LVIGTVTVIPTGQTVRPPVGPTVEPPLPTVIPTLCEIVRALTPWRDRGLIIGETMGDAGRSATTVRRIVTADNPVSGSNPIPMKE